MNLWKICYLFYLQYYSTAKTNGLQKVMQVLSIMSPRTGFLIFCKKFTVQFWEICRDIIIICGKKTPDFTGFTWEKSKWKNIIFFAIKNHKENNYYKQHTKNVIKDNKTDIVPRTLWDYSIYVFSNKNAFSVDEASVLVLNH